MILVPSMEMYLATWVVGEIVAFCGAVAYSVWGSSWSCQWAIF